MPDLDAPLTGSTYLYQARAFDPERWAEARAFDLDEVPVPCSMCERVDRPGLLTQHLVNTHDVEFTEAVALSVRTRDDRDGDGVTDRVVQPVDYVADLMAIHLREGMTEVEVKQIIGDRDFDCSFAGPLSGASPVDAVAYGLGIIESGYELESAYLVLRFEYGQLAQLRVHPHSVARRLGID